MQIHHHRLQSLIRFTLLLGTLFPALIPSLSRSDSYLDRLRTDSNLPEHCVEPRLEHFISGFETVTYGIDGARDRGFTHEYPLDREAASLMWNGYRDIERDQARRDYFYRNEVLPEYQSAVETINENRHAMGFDFKVEGEVLEILALDDLRREFPESRYFHTGGVIYHEAHSNRTIGELDILVGDRRTCKILIVGEAKLGVHRVGKAREQIARFVNFLSQRRDESFLSQLTFIDAEF